MQCTKAGCRSPTAVEEVERVNKLARFTIQGFFTELRSVCPYNKSSNVIILVLFILKTR